MPWNKTIWCQRTLDAGVLGLVAKAARAEFEAVDLTGAGGNAGAEGKIYS